MEPIYVYPASFCPPTYGHLFTLKKAAAMFPSVILLCSENPDKVDNWFTPEESKSLWYSYPLPGNVQVMTLQDMRNRKFDMSQVVMIRGVRHEDDAEYEKTIMLQNHAEFGISTFVIFFSDDEHKGISSSKSRKLAEELHLGELSKMVSPLVQTRLLEKVLGLNNLFMVVGPPASGKSTLLGEVKKLDPNAVHIDTDKFSHALRGQLEEAFAGQDLIDVAINNAVELMNIIKKPWLKMLTYALRSAAESGAKDVYVEIPYGLREDMELFRLVGGKVICVGTRDLLLNKWRLEHRGTPGHDRFLRTIPGIDESERIAQKYRLKFHEAQLDRSLDFATREAEFLVNYYSRRSA